MLRRKLLKSGLLAGAAALGGKLTWDHYFDQHLFNPCSIEKIPPEIMQHELMQQALADIDFSQLWDCHFHLIGNGQQPSIDNQFSDIWLSPDMQSWRHPIKHLQYWFYLNAACIQNTEYADKEFLQKIDQLLLSIPRQTKFMLLAFDYQYSDSGKVNQQASSFYIPNQYAAKIAQLKSSFEWIGSVHPYREDALAELDWCKKNGAKAIKWLPPAMNIDPSSSKCDKFYQRLIQLKLPLLTHAGEEKAVHSEDLQRLSNPLLLRRPLDIGVKVIIAHCATLGASEDFESNGKPSVNNLDLFARLMNDSRYENNLLADISAINLFNRKIEDIKTILRNQQWHSRLLYASDYPLPGVMPITSSTNLAHHNLLKTSQLAFLQQLKTHNVWLFDFVQKRLLSSEDNQFLPSVFSTRRHFESESFEVLISEKK